MQRHVIKRQIVELQVDQQADAYPIQTEISRIFAQRVLTLIDRYCTELSAPNQIHRIESLELDLGSIDANELEETLVARLEAALRQALAAEISSADPRAEIASALERFETFITTGTLPWWADATQPALLDDTLETLLRSASDALRLLLRQLVQEPSSLHRLITTFGDEQLAQLFGLLSSESGWAADLPALIALLRQAARVQVRQMMWARLLREAVSSPGEQPSTVMERLITTLNLSSDQLLAAARSQGQETLYHEYFGAPVSTDTAQPEATLTEQAQRAADIPALIALLKRVAPGEIEQAMWEMLRHEAASGIDSDILRRVMQQLIAALGIPTDALLAAARASDQEALYDDYFSASESTDTAQPAAADVAKLIALLNRFAPDDIEQVVWEMLLREAANSADSDWLRRVMQQLVAVLGIPVDQLRAAARSNGFETLYRDYFGATKPATPRARPEPVQLADELYIGNSGLVILWPFLERFFARLDLLADQQFRDAAAQQRAIGLLQVLAAGESSLVEYLLPLNKLLCGVELDAVFDFGEPLTEVETAECANLLQAIIEQTPILSNMSVDGLRGTFLLRQGMLSLRDGLWLLRVEQATYDIVLERFPWSWAWVKLPWMPAPLRVEW